MNAKILGRALADAGIAAHELTPLPELAAALTPTPSYFALTRGADTPTPIYVLPVAADALIGTWERLRMLTDVTGQYPVILGGARSVYAHYTHLTDARRRLSPADQVRAAARIDARTWLDTHWSAYFDADDDFGEADVRGEWTNPVYDLTRDPRETLASEILGYKPDATQYIALVETVYSWEVPAHLNYGGWNACPAPAVHVALQRHWAERWGSEIVAATFDTLVCRTRAPLIDRDTALALARDHMMYCDDIVMQGTGTLDALAAELITHQSWFFWWD
ncbi:MAG: DUF4253 domain-containing protein [Chloroflexota bacterium]|nr:DUF4253 domain-containing protein [Chloroflexota bacterium]